MGSSGQTSKQSTSLLRLWRLVLHDTAIYSILHTAEVLQVYIEDMNHSASPGSMFPETGTYSTQWLDGVVGDWRCSTTSSFSTSPSLQQKLGVGLHSLAMALTANRGFTTQGWTNTNQFNSLNNIRENLPNFTFTSGQFFNR